MLRKLIAAGFLALLAAPAARADVIVTGFAEGSIRHYLNNGTQLAPITAQTVFGAAGMAVGSNGTIYVASQTSLFGPPGTPDFIYRVDSVTGTATPLIPLPAIGSDPYVPGGVRIGPGGELYVTRNGGQTAGAGTGWVDRFDANTGAFIDRPVQDLSQPTAMVFRGSDLFISNFAAGNVVHFDGNTTETFASGGGLVTPTGLAFGPDNNLYVTDTVGSAVRRYSGANGAFIDDFIPGGAASVLLNQFPSDLIFDQPGRLLVANLGASFNPGDPPNLHGNVMSFDSSTGAFIADFATDILGASQIASFTPIPEPTSMVLMGSAIAGLAWWRRRR